MITQGRITVTAVLVLSLFATDNALARDACARHQKAINSYAQKPLLNERRKASLVNCAGAMARNSINILFGNRKSNTNATDVVCKNQVGVAVEEGTETFVSNQFEQHGNRQQVQAILDEDATAHAANGRSIATDIERLRQCRVKELEKIKMQFMRERITPAKYEKELNGLQKRIDSDNELIAKVVGMTDEDLKVLQANNEELDNLAGDGDADTTAGGAATAAGGSGAIADATRSQEELQQQQASYEDLLRQIEEEKAQVTEDV